MPYTWTCQTSQWDQVYGPTTKIDKVGSKSINSPWHLILSTISKYLINIPKHLSKRHHRWFTLKACLKTKPTYWCVHLCILLNYRVFGQVRRSGFNVIFINLEVFKSHVSGETPETISYKPQLIGMLAPPYMIWTETRVYTTLTTNTSPCGERKKKKAIL